MGPAYNLLLTMTEKVKIKEICAFPGQIETSMHWIAHFVTGIASGELGSNTKTL
jgi:hypothetical protein